MTNTPNTDKITCNKCGREDVPDWNGKGHCITCARDEVLGTPNTPIEDEPDQFFREVELGGRLMKWLSLTHLNSNGDFAHKVNGSDITNAVKELLAWRDNAVEKAVRELSNRTAIQAGEMLARLTTPTKEREENNE